jgi:Zn-dependent protease
MILNLEPKPTPWDLKWVLFGIPVRVHPLFWAVSLLLWYEKTIPFTHVLTAIACGFVSILTHEFGHAFAQRYYGDRHNHIVLYQLGGLACGSRQAPGYWPRVFVSLWGPGAGFILGGIAACVFYALKYQWLPPVDPHVYIAVFVLYWTNLIWGLVNLLPIFPLDGGQIMRETVLRKAPRRGDFFVFTISFYAAIAAAVACLGLYVYDLKQNAPASLFNVIFFAVLAISSWMARRQIGQFGNLDGGDDEPRQTWEQDPDWWKR